jgi:hypothetical protein
MKSATQNHRNLTKLAGSHRRRSVTRVGPEGGKTLKTSCSQRSSGKSRRRRSRLGNESGSPVHHEVVKMRCVSDRECRSPIWRSFVMRIRNAMATGMAMMMKVHDTHAVLWAVRKRVEGMKYTGMGTARDRMAKRETVTGNPKERGHLVEFRQSG